MITIKKIRILYLLFILIFLLVDLGRSSIVDGASVATSNGLVQVNNLKPGDKLLSYNFNASQNESPLVESSITKIHKHFADSAFRIHVSEDRCICLSPQQLIFVVWPTDEQINGAPFTIDLVQAQYLTTNHMLLDTNLHLIPITEIVRFDLYKEETFTQRNWIFFKKKYQCVTKFVQVYMYSLELEDPHTFLIPIASLYTKPKDDPNIQFVLLHNGIPALGASLSFAFGSTPSSVSFASASLSAGGLSVIFGPVGLALGVVSGIGFLGYQLFKSKKKQPFFYLERADPPGTSNNRNPKKKDHKDPDDKTFPPIPPTSPFDEKKRNNSSVGDFAKKISKMSPNERVAAVKTEARAIANNKGFERVPKLSGINDRDVYRDPKSGNLYSLDTQHGRFEVLNKKGTHMGEVDFDFNITKGPDLSGRHNLKT